MKMRQDLKVEHLAISGLVLGFILVSAAAVHGLWWRTTTEPRRSAGAVPAVSRFSVGQKLGCDHRNESEVAFGSCIMVTSERNAHRPRIVIVGAGFGGLSAAMALANSDFAVTLIDRHNYHLFQPLLTRLRRQRCHRPILLRRSAELCVDKLTSA